MITGSELVTLPSLIKAQIPAHKRKSVLDGNSKINYYLTYGNFV